MQDDIFSLVRDAETTYTSGAVKISKYVNWSMYDTIQTIDAYLNSTHISGKTDSLGREKPFFNICTAATNVWYRATDIDRKDIRILPSCYEDTALALAATAILQEWMNRERFGQFLNLWGRALARYGSAVVKFVKQDGTLKPSVIPWARLIVDPIDFTALPVIEKLYRTPAQLLQAEGYNQKIVKALIESRSPRKDLEGQSRDIKDDFIELYEVHGELSLATYKKSKGEEPKEGDEKVFFQQMHVLTFVFDEQNKKYDDFTLYSGREEKSPYMLTHLIEEEGRTLSIGAVEYLFDAQWMVNHTEKQQKDYLDLASKLVFQTSDTHFIGRNVLTEIETGSILVNQLNQPLTALNTAAGNISASIQFGQGWMNLSRELTSTTDSMRGNTLPSGTPYSLGALLTQNANSLFELMTENKGLCIEEMMRVHVLPFTKTKFDTSEEIAAILDERGIAELDALYVPREAIRRYNKRSFEQLLKEQIPSPYQADLEQNAVKNDLAGMGNKRFIKPSEIKTKTWKQVLKDFETKVRVEVTNESTDKQAVMQTLATLYTTAAKTDPVAATIILAKIMTETGVVSPLELSAKRMTVPTPMQPSAMGEVTPLTNSQ